MKMIRYAFFAALLLSAATAMAWGPDGHKLVAEVAKSYLRKNVADSVQKYLGSATFEEASVWMDEMRSNPTYDYMKPWHYVNVEKDKTYVSTADWNVINVLIKAIDKLEKRRSIDKDEMAMYLRVLFHLAGDIHQPLHAGYSDDRGGNDIKLKFLDKPSNLHRVWDEEIILNKKIDLAACLAMASMLTPKQKFAELSNTSVLSWMSESRVLLPQVYDFKDNKIDQAYADKNAPVVEKQILLGGMHLAAVLNRIFSAN